MKKKTLGHRILTVTLALLMLIGVASALAYDRNSDGKTNVWDLQLLRNEGNTQDAQAALNEALGGGNELKPNAEGVYEIYTALGLYNMASIITENKDEGVTFRLMNDINMNGAVWQTTGSFNGILEGDGHVIANLNIVGEMDLSTANDTDYGLGFFGKIGKGGAVRNVKLENATAVLYPESKACFIGLLAASVTGEITNCTTVGTVIDPRTKLPPLLTSAPWWAALKMCPPILSPASRSPIRPF